MPVDPDTMADLDLSNPFFAAVVDNVVVFAFGPVLSADGGRADIAVGRRVLTDLDPDLDPDPGPGPDPDPDPDPSLGLNPGPGPVFDVNNVSLHPSCSCSRCRSCRCPLLEVTFGPHAAAAVVVVVKLTIAVLVTVAVAVARLVLIRDNVKFSFSSSSSSSSSPLRRRQRLASTSERRSGGCVSAATRDGDDLFVEKYCLVSSSLSQNESRKGGFSSACASTGCASTALKSKYCVGQRMSLKRNDASVSSIFSLRCSSRFQNENEME